MSLPSIDVFRTAKDPNGGILGVDQQLALPFQIATFQLACVGEGILLFLICRTKFWLESGDIECFKKLLSVHVFPTEQGVGDSDLSDWRL